MKFIKTLFFFLMLTTCFTSYANENKYIFVGKTGAAEDEKIAFILNLLDTDIEKYILISEATGEVFIKVDKIVAASKDPLLDFRSFETFSDHIAALSDSKDEDSDVKCSKCKYYYNPQFYKGRRCPRCDTAN